MKLGGTQDARLMLVRDRTTIFPAFHSGDRESDCLCEGGTAPECGDDFCDVAHAGAK